MLANWISQEAFSALKEGFVVAVTLEAGERGSRCRGGDFEALTGPPSRSLACGSSFLPLPDQSFAVFYP
jgi:hypothetical protein